MSTRGGWLALGLVLGAGSVAEAYFLDKGRNFDVRVRAYSQLGIFTQNSCSLEDGCPQYDLGDLAQHRNFYNPEFDAKLTDYMRWWENVPGLELMTPDEFKFRFAYWGFYDGLYDYLNPRWGDNLRDLKARPSRSNDPQGESFAFNDEYKRGRNVYAHQNRINEMYLDYTKGRVFVRAGKQGISWGESDSIALLDVQNNFDITLGAPGLFQDVDEARIPLWTLRTTVKLVDSWKWLSSFFLDAYVVPGIIDTTVPINPIVGGVSPFGPDVLDPQAQVAGQTLPGPEGKPPRTLHLVQVDRLPTENWSNTRWGARLTGVLGRTYTVQGWFFRTFNQAPAPVLANPGAVKLNVNGRLGPTQVDNRGRRTPVCNGIDPTTGLGRTPAGRPCSLALPVVTVLERRLESVVGLAATWYNQPLNGIIRTEAEYFHDELAVVPNRNLNARSQIPGAILQAFGGEAEGTDIPKADYLRFLLGYDRFFFFRPLNPTNSFVLSMAFNGSWNLTETFDGVNFRAAQTKPGKPNFELANIKGLTNPGTGQPLCRGDLSALGQLAQLCVKTPNKNYEDIYPFEGFLQTAIQTDYLHGRLQPRIVFITDISGVYAFAPSMTYRINDSILATMSYVGIEGSRKALLATFKEHDMVFLRLTYQLN